jgi:cation-transporting ATPase E
VSDPVGGLTSAEVAARVHAGQVNLVPEVPSRTVGQILRANIFTRFNALMGTLLAIVLLCQAWKDALFGGVIVANAVIGIVQELRAKRTLDRLAVLSAPRATIVRGGEVAEHAVSEIVLDDVLVLRQGRQVVADAEVLVADHLEVDESLLTGESDPVVKEVGDELMSGSFVVAGSGRARVAKVGADAYAAQLAEQARRFTLARSELRASMERIITWVTWALVPTGAVLFWSQLKDASHTGRGPR